MTKVWLRTALWLGLALAATLDAVRVVRYVSPETL